MVKTMTIELLVPVSTAVNDLQQLQFRLSYLGQFLSISLGWIGSNFLVLLSNPVLF